MSVKLKKINVTALAAYVNKLLNVDDFIYLTVKGINTSSLAYLPEKDAIKLQETSTIELFEAEDGEHGWPEGTLKIAFFNGAKFLEALKHFGGMNLTGEIAFQEVGDNEYVATSFHLLADELKIRCLCSDPSLGFDDLSPDVIKNIFSVDDRVFEFEVEPFHIDKLRNLFKLEKEVTTFRVAVDNAGIKFKGDSYEILVSDQVQQETPSEVIFYKKYVDLFDSESYKVAVCGNKGIFRSKDTSSVLSIATCNQ